MERGNLDGRSIVKEYRDYCLPIVPLTLVLFISNIADRWLLQYFGGSKEQAFYSIGLQFSTVCLVLVSSMSRIFWKEISEALENKDRDRVKILYQKTCRFFFTSTTVICCFIIPWSRDITEVFLGPSYIDGSGVLAIMLLSPIYMSLLQILTIILLASGKTKSYSIIQCISTSFSIPITYFIQASPNSKVPGLDLGAYGIAWKGILFSMIITNIIAWLLSREYEWKFDWLYQVVGLILFLFLGWFSFNVVSALSSLVPLHLVAKVSITFLLYSTISTIIVWAMPWLVGMTRAEFELNISFGLIPNRKK